MINYQTTIVELFKPANSHFFLSQDGNYFFMLMDDRLCMFDQQLKEIEIQQQQQLQGKFSNINRINQASKVLKFAFLCGQQIIIVDIIQQNSQFISEEIIVIDEEKPQTVALSPFGDLLITGDQIGTIKLWDLKKIQEPLWVFKNESHIIQRFSFNPNGTDIVAAVGDGSVNLYSIDYFEDQNILENNDNQKQNQNQSQVKDKEDKKLKFTCYKSFTRQSLIQADHCKINNSQICQNGKSILELFKQKGAI
ncbi:unnamed protein product [Paramecium sonneborni]|uniref:WD40-repeat-containing domain n=1 Tax=Paramecium sonneborni TaxID=65129 RepID=A0A8S1PZM5_9CILI|nr:unnamed protein product [Paramecium sonneborni]